MVKRGPYQQAVRPLSGHQRDTRWRFFVAGGVALAIGLGVVLLPPGNSPSTRGADARPADTMPAVDVAVAADAAMLDPEPRQDLILAAGPTSLPWDWGTTPRTDRAPTPSRSPDTAVAAPTPSATAGPDGRPPAASPTSKEPEELSGYGWPLYRGRMTSFFGPRDSGFLVIDGERYHPGLDTTTFCGDQVRAAHKGVVVAAGRRFASEAGFSGPVDRFYARIARQGTMGLQPIVVIVDDGNGYRSMYVHLSQAMVKVGDKVSRRTVIGLEGDSGNANGCHVHYELIRMDGRWMRVAKELVKEYGYPEWQRERVDPLRVLSLKEKRSGRFVPGILRPKLPASLRTTRSPKPSPTAAPSPSASPSP